MQFTKEGDLLLFDKPYRWSSFDVVKKVKYMLRLGKVGHAGTLDPLATGLLLLCTGKLTKEIDQFQELDKAYDGVIQFGLTTPSLDMETMPKFFPTFNGTLADIQMAAEALTGTQLQFPPLYSAVKQDGKRLYKSARRGKEVEIRPRSVDVFRFDILEYEAPFARFQIVCGKGTYVRTLVYDLGERLGTGCVLSELRRTRIGQYDVAQASTMESLASLAESFRTENA